MSSPQLTKGRCSRIDHIYSVTTICRDRKRLFADAVVIGCLTDQIERLARDGIVENLAWVVMPDHVHWMFALRRGRLSDAVGLFKGRSAHAINNMLGTGGAVWQAGYYDHALRGDEDVAACARYLLENPIRAGLAGSIEEYPYAWCMWGAVDL